MRAHHYMNAGGLCHAGDLFEQGTPFIALFTAEQLAAAWDKGWEERNDDCGEPYSPRKHNPYLATTKAN